MELLGVLRTQVRANRLANHRLEVAMAVLSHDEFHAARTSFFPSLAETLDHLLAIDRYYLAALHREPDMAAQWRASPKCESAAEWARHQVACDRRFIGFLDRSQPGDLDEVIELDRMDHVQREAIGHVVLHLLNHQVHHRGQVHAMLSGTSVKPPQLDEFLMPSEAAVRAADMAALGWREEALFSVAPTCRSP